MGAPAIYNIPSRRRSGGALNGSSVSPVVNGVDKKLISNGSYEKYLKVGPIFDASNLFIATHT